MVANYGIGHSHIYQGSLGIINTKKFVQTLMFLWGLIYPHRHRLKDYRIPSDGYRMNICIP